MSKRKESKKFVSDNSIKKIEICEFKSHNKALSNERIITLIKLLARQAAEEDYAKIIKSDRNQWW